MGVVEDKPPAKESYPMAKRSDGRDLVQPVLLALAAAALFGAATPVSKLLLGSISPFQLAGLLYWGAAAGVLPLLIAEPAGDAPGMLTRSAASLAATGTGSASEAAALAAAGPGARLLGPRLVLGPVTCALAEGEAS